MSLKKQEDNIIFDDLMKEDKRYLASWVLHNMTSEKKREYIENIYKEE